MQSAIKKYHSYSADQNMSFSRKGFMLDCSHVEYVISKILLGNLAKIYNSTRNRVVILLKYQNKNNIYIDF